MELSTKQVNRNIFHHLLGNSLSYFGDLIYLMALNLWIAKNTEGPHLLSIISTIGSFVMFIGNPIGGLIADSFNKKNLIIVADLMCGIGTLITFIYFEKNHINLIPIIVSQVILSLAFAIYSPTSRSIAPLLASDQKLRSLNSYLSVSSEVIKMIVPGLTGLLLTFSFITEKELILINTISFFVSACNNMFLISTEKKTEVNLNVGHMLKSYVDVWRELGHVKVILLPICLVNFFSGGITVLFPFLGKAVSVSHYPNLLLFQAIGAMLGGLLSSRMKQDLDWSQSRWLLIVCGAVLMFLTPQINQYVHYASMMVFGVAISIFNVNFFTIVQKVTPNHIIGRTFGLIFAVSSGLVPFGSYIFGIIGEKVPVHAIQVAGVGMILAILVLMIFHKYLSVSYLKEEN